MKIHGLHDIEKLTFFNNKDLYEIIIFLEEARHQIQLERIIMQNEVEIKCLKEKLQGESSK